MMVSVRAPTCDVISAVQLQVYFNTSENFAGTDLHQLGHRGGAPNLFWLQRKHQRDGEDYNQQVHLCNGYKQPEAQHTR